MKITDRERTDDTYEGLSTVKSTIIMETAHIAVIKPVWNVTTYHSIFGGPTRRVLQPDIPTIIRSTTASVDLIPVLCFFFDFRICESPITNQLRHLTK